MYGSPVLIDPRDAVHSCSYLQVLQPRAQAAGLSVRILLIDFFFKTIAYHVNGDLTVLWLLTSLVAVPGGGGGGGAC